MSYVTAIIRRFGETRAAAARAIGIPERTVEAWERRGAISRRGQERLLRQARAKGIALSPADFFPGVPDDTGDSESASVSPRTQSAHPVVSSAAG